MLVLLGMDWPAIKLPSLSNKDTAYLANISEGTPYLKRLSTLYSAMITPLKRPWELVKGVCN